MEGDLLDETLDAIDRMVDERSHTGGAQITFRELAAELGRSDVGRTVQAVTELKKRGSFLALTIYGPNDDGRFQVITRRRPDGSDARGMLLHMLVQRADDLSMVDGKFGDIQDFLSHLSLSDADTKDLLRNLEREGAVEDMLRLGGIGATIPFRVRIL
ncbi:MAG: hypothetical protein K8H88_14190 [Sandaracinaceae bacterium]|nr:hypothetical protein [Sandaracinaceae bacterium]